MSNQGGDAAGLQQPPDQRLLLQLHYTYQFTGGILGSQQGLLQQPNPNDGAPSTSQSSSTSRSVIVANPNLPRRDEPCTSRAAAAAEGSLLQESGGLQLPEEDEQQQRLRHLQLLLKLNIPGRDEEAEKQATCPDPCCQKSLRHLTQVRDKHARSLLVQYAVGFGCALRMLVCAYAKTQRVNRQDIPGKPTKVSSTENSFAALILEALIEKGPLPGDDDSVKFANSLIRMLKKRKDAGSAAEVAESAPDSDSDAEIPEVRIASKAWSVSFPELAKEILQQQLQESPDEQPESTTEWEKCERCAKSISKLDKVVSALAALDTVDATLHLGRATLMMVIAYANESDWVVESKHERASCTKEEREGALEMVSNLLKAKTHIATVKQSINFTEHSISKSPKLRMPDEEQFYKFGLSEKRCSMQMRFKKISTAPQPKRDRSAKVAQRQNDPQLQQVVAKTMQYVAAHLQHGLTQRVQQLLQPQQPGTQPNYNNLWSDLYAASAAAAAASNAAAALETQQKEANRSAPSQQGSLKRTLD